MKYFMKKHINKKKYLLLFSFIFVFWIIINVYAFNWSKLNSDANWFDNDEWSLTWTIVNENPTSIEYASWLRWKVTVDIIKSTLFWDFNVKSWEIKLYDSTNTDCWTGKTYKIEWDLVINSLFWWDTNLDQNNSYFCPWNSSLFLTFFSNQLWDKIVWEITSLTWLVFDNSEIYISWITSIKWDVTNLNENIVEDQNINNINISNVNGEISKLNLIINKNIYQITKNLIPETSDNILSTIDNKQVNDKYYYYDYTWVEWDDNSLWNKWKNLIIRKHNFDINNPWSYKIWVKWKNIVIVKWWNIYIDADIYNENDNSDILLIIAKRDENNKQNWWNIYINSSVTNIDAILIADWSLLSYDWTKALNTIDDEINALWRQLLIYGSVNTKNVIWENISVYWTDTYFDTWEEVESNYYNLVNMRNLYLTYASSSFTEECWWDDTKIIARQSNNNVLKYALAWKKECYLDDSNTIEWLKITDKTNSIVILYNSKVMKLKPAILQNN